MISMAKTDYERLERYLKTNRPIQIDTRLIVRILGYDDMRDFFMALANWGHNTDFTYNEGPTMHPQRYLRAFLKSFLE